MRKIIFYLIYDFSRRLDVFITTTTKKIASKSNIQNACQNYSSVITTSDNFTIGVPSSFVWSKAIFKPLKS